MGTMGILKDVVLSEDDVNLPVALATAVMDGDRSTGRSTATCEY